MIGIAFAIIITALMIRYVWVTSQDLLLEQSATGESAKEMILTLVVFVSMGIILLWVSVLGI